MIGSSLIWKKRKISRIGYSLSFVVTRCQSLSIVIIRCHSLCHSLLLVVPLVVIRFQSLLFVVTRCHSLYESLSLVVTRCITRLSFYKRFDIHTLIMFRLVNFGKHIWVHKSKIKEIYTYFKISSWDEVFTRLFFFFSSRNALTSRNEISSLSFWRGWVHPGMKFHLGKNV